MFIEINSNSINCHGDRICGDSFLQRYIPNQRRTVAVLSDGMGHGVKANILSSLTASIIVNMGQANESIRKIANTILQTLPVCNIRGISYSTFTIIDIDHTTSITQIIEYDNPMAIVMRANQPLKLEREESTIDNEQKTAHSKRQTLYFSKFTANEGDRIIICSDGVTQSGLGSQKYPFGWTLKNFSEFVRSAITENHAITSHDLSLNVLKTAWQNDERRSKDDITCSVFTFRKSRRLMLCSCPPSNDFGCEKLANKIIEYTGQTVICGYPLAEIIADKLNSSIRKNVSSTDPNLPPLWFIDGVDLITEGFLTLTRVLDILENFEQIPIGRGPAYRVVKMIMASDHIQMIIGMRESDSNTQFIDNFQIRRKLLERITTVLEVKFAKAITKEYI